MYLLLGMMGFVGLFLFAFTELQLCELRLSYVKFSNDFYDFFTNIFKFLEQYINNLDNQETTTNFKNKNPTTNKSIVEPSLTNNLEVDKEVNKLKNINLESKDIDTTTNSDTKKLNALDY